MSLSWSLGGPGEQYDRWITAIVSSSLTTKLLAAMALVSYARGPLRNGHLATMSPSEGECLVDGITTGHAVRDAGSSGDISALGSEKESGSNPSSAVT